MVFWEKQKKIKALYELCSKPVRADHGLTQMEYSVLLFLHRNPAYDTASSIVQTGQFTKSHVSSAIRELEERKLITRGYRGNNNKTIHLTLTARAEEILREAENAYERYKGCLFAGFSEEEMQLIRDFFARICENAEAELRNAEEVRKDA